MYTYTNTHTISITPLHKTPFCFYYFSFINYILAIIAFLPARLERKNLLFFFLFLLSFLLSIPDYRYIKSTPQIMDLPFIETKRTYTPDQLRALAPTASTRTPLDHNTRQHLIDLGIYSPHSRAIRNKERQRKRSIKNKTALPIVTTANLRSINNKQEELHQYLLDSRSDIACLTETWIDEHNSHRNNNQILDRYL